MNRMELEWNVQKALINYRKQGVRFSEAVTIWQDIAALEVIDALHSHNEVRWIRMGFSMR